MRTANIKKGLYQKILKQIEKQTEEKKITAYAAHDELKKPLSSVQRYLYHLEKMGYIKGETERTPGGLERKFYDFTLLGVIGYLAGLDLTKPAITPQEAFILLDRVAKHTQTPETVCLVTLIETAKRLDLELANGRWFFRSQFADFLCSATPIIADTLISYESPYGSPQLTLQHFVRLLLTHLYGLRQNKVSEGMKENVKKITNLDVDEKIIEWMLQMRLRLIEFLFLEAGIIEKERKEREAWVSYFKKLEGERTELKKDIKKSLTSLFSQPSPATS